MYNNVNIHIPIPMLKFPWCFKCGTPGLAQGIQRGVTATPVSAVPRWVV